MTSMISTDDAAATSHVDAPVQVATRDHGEAADVDGKGAASAEEQEQAAARRDVFLLAGIRKLIKSFRSLSHIFELYKDEEDEDDDIQIGFPTDVEHVAHIGLDGSSSVASLRGMDGARELLSLSTNISLQQFEFAMASIAAHDDRSAAIAASP
ncbi:hypothetical protein VPH35_054770 [Triticum aestivum]|uniref:CRIB domain-containing protein n=1 Tax=Triticum aestivum TaxID=4565 RepID=W5CZZ5_WHEAT|nr:uncharacterized protein LOC123066189 [Triticum aestivum]CDM85698.1 unnamed protein product [Triticum aestivum]